MGGSCPRLTVDQNNRGMTFGRLSWTYCNQDDSEEVFLQENTVNSHPIHHKVSEVCPSEILCIDESTNLQSFTSSELFQTVVIYLYSLGEVFDSGEKYVLTVVDLYSCWL